MALNINLNDSALTNLIQSGADALTNLYYIEFKSDEINKDALEMLKIRSQEFQAPTFTQSSNPVNYLTNSLTLPLVGIEGTKELSFTFRLDSNYRLYKTLLFLQSKTMLANSSSDSENSPNFATNNVPTDPSEALTINVYASINNEIKRIYQFNYCWIKSITGLDYSYDNSSAMKISVKVGFFEYDDTITQ